MNFTNQTDPSAVKSGYDLPVYGLRTDHFLRIHIPALVAIFFSLICVIIILIASFIHQSILNFFKWSKPERFVVYLALCDGLFNICHSMDHLQILITEDHVYPKDLCSFYAAILIEFVAAQHVMVSIICVNAFLLVYYQRNMKFGPYDWKLLATVFGIPAIIAFASIGMNVLGPTGAFCYFDGIKGQTAFIYLHTVPVVAVMVMVSILYTLIWFRIRKSEAKFKILFNKRAHHIRASNRAARNMSLFVIALVIQWWSSAFFGIWQFTNKEIPHILFQFLTFFPNIGGVLNLLVYYIIRQRKSTMGADPESYVSSSERDHTMKILPQDKKYITVSSSDI